MYIYRPLLLVIGVILIFIPAIEIWVMSSESTWYRPFQLWFLVVIAAYWNQRTRYPNGL
ncbi:MAG TPA: hypothetical protein VIV27_09480 [Halioglobus sp.]